MIRSAALVAALTLQLVGAGHTLASTTVGVGVDYVTGPLAQSTRDILGFAVTSWNGKDLTAALARYEHSDLGAGTIGSGSFVLPLSKSTSAQISGARTVGEDSFRAWLFQIGPVFSMGQSRTLTLLYTRSGNTLGPGASGFSSEAAIPVSPRVNLSGRGSVASAEGGGTTFQGAVGVLWGLSRRVVFLGELGTGRDVTALAQGAAFSGATPQALGGPSYVSGSALQIGLRYIIH